MAMTRTQHLLRRSIAVTSVALVLVLGWIGIQASPSTEAVRLRNALLIEEGRPDVGAWRPEQMPSAFLAERRAVPPLIAAAARTATVAGGSELERSRALASHLLSHLQDSGPISSPDLVRSYRAIVEEGRGYCADVINAFVALALAVDIPVRTWAFSFDGYGGHGHIVAEIFDRQHGDWIMLDVFNNVHPVSADGEPMSAMEFRAAFANRAHGVAFAPFAEGRIAYSKDARLREYYRAGIDHWYLWNGNNVVTRSEAAPYRLLSFASGAAQLAAVALGDHPTLVPLSTEASRPAIASMHHLAHRLRAAIAMAMLLAAALLVQCLLLLRELRRSRAASAQTRLHALPPATRPIGDRHA